MRSINFLLTYLLTYLLNSASHHIFGCWQWYSSHSSIPTFVFLQKATSEANLWAIPWGHSGPPLSRVVVVVVVVVVDIDAQAACDSGGSSDTW